MKKTLTLGVYLAMTLAVVDAPIMANAGVLPYSAYAGTTAQGNLQIMSGQFGSVSASGTSPGTAAGTGSASYSNGSGSVSGYATSSGGGYGYPSYGSGSGLVAFTVAVIGPSSAYNTYVPVYFTASGTASTSANNGGSAQASASFGAALYQGPNYLGSEIGTSIEACDSPGGGCGVSNTAGSFSFGEVLKVSSSYFSGSSFYSLTQAVVDMQAGCGVTTGAATGLASCIASVDPMAYIDPTFNSSHNNEISLIFSPNPPGSTSVPEPTPASLFLIALGLLV